METLLHEKPNPLEYLQENIPNTRQTKELFIETIQYLSISFQTPDNLKTQKKLIQLLPFLLLRIPTKRHLYYQDAFPLITRFLKLQTTPIQAIQVAIEVYSPLVQDLQTSGESDTIHQKRWLIASLLHAFSLLPLQHELPHGSAQAGTQLLELVQKCHIPLQYILLTYRWNQEFQLHKALMVSEDIEEIVAEIDELDLELDPDVHDPYYFMPNPDGIRELWPSMLASERHDSWDIAGILRLVYWIYFLKAVDESVRQMGPPDQLYLVAPYLENLLTDKENKESNIIAFTILRHMATDLLPESVTMSRTAFDDAPESDSFEAYIEFEIATHWYKPLLQALINAMVMCSEAKTRMQAYQSLQKLLRSIDSTSRCPILIHLIEACPFPNVCSLLIDHLKQDVVKNWKADHSSSQDPMLLPFIRRVFVSTSDQALVERMDVYVSLASLYRFWLIRDKDNCTGVWDQVPLEKLKALIKSLLGRINYLISDAQSMANSRQQLQKQTQIHQESTHDGVVSFEISTENTTRPQPCVVKADLHRLYIFHAAIEALEETITSKEAN